MSWPVIVSNHALEQAAERAGVTDPATIVEQVTAALEAGRLSARRPTWLKPRANGHGLYAWTADDATAFVLVADADCFHVLTVLTASEEAAA
jgi:hypothetical protein